MGKNRERETEQEEVRDGRPSTAGQDGEVVDSNLSITTDDEKRRGREEAGSTDTGTR